MNTNGVWFTCSQCGMGYQTGTHFCSGVGSITVPWNGPICSICGSGYLGKHECDPRVLRAKAEHLNDLANQIDLAHERGDDDDR